jgi:hypothetical protein
MFAFEKFLQNYKKKSPLFLSHKYVTEREGFKDTTSAKEIGFFPLIKTMAHRVSNSGLSSTESPLLLQPYRPHSVGLERHRTCKNCKSKTEFQRISKIKANLLQGPLDFLIKSVHS